MYNFVDTTETQGETPIPSEAMKFNGAYIESQITGYQTLTVQGRETLSPAIESYESGVSDGSSFKSKRFPSRTITVKYQLQAPTNELFRSRYNQLNAILNVEDAQMIFADEQDKYFVGTPNKLGDVDPGRNAVTGEIEILCLDPFKYSVDEFEVSPTIDEGTTFAVTYNGTYRAYPTFEADFAEEVETETGTLAAKGDCGYVAFLSSNEKIIQLGDSDEEDTVEYEESQTLISQNMTVWDTYMQGLWALNSGYKLPTTTHTGSIKAGTDEWGNKMLCASSYGSSGVYHGPSITRAIPADASGHVGAANFRCTWKQRLAMAAGTNNQYGTFQCLLVNNTDGVRKVVAGISIYKNSAATKAEWYYYVNSTGAAIRQTGKKYDLTRNGSLFGYKTGIAVLYSTIQKSGGTVTFNIGGVKRSFTDPTIADTEVNELTFVFGNLRTGNAAIKSNGLFKVKFIKDKCTGYEDIPNKFSSNDIAVANCSDGLITLNGSPAPELGALGNDWEEFYLSPGTNQVGVTYSDWVNTAPTFKMRYRERFL